jgi:2-polyprenyl-3-methyl-5-hydroxy-6-metoxy-1,4-benzoquinol methylase
MATATSPSKRKAVSVTTAPLCPICGAASLQLGEKIGHHARTSFLLFRCPDCRFAFVDPPWSGMWQAYNEEYYEGHGIDPSVDYLFELEAPGETIRFYEWKGFAELIGGLIRLNSRTRWLDYGCGNGGLVRYLRERGIADAAGFDHGWIAAHSRKLGIPVLTEEELSGQDGEFDVITMLEVIEHVVDPVAVLKHARRLLKPGGILYLTTGNAKPYRNCLPAWRYVIPEIHVSYFEPRTLETALTRAGFRPEYQIRPRGYADILRFKILKNIGIRKRGLLERAVPWRAVSFLADLRYQVTYHPYGVAVPETVKKTKRITPTPVGTASSTDGHWQFPAPPGFAGAAVWTGTEFRIGDTVTRVLCYDSGSSGWTEELTDLHEGVDDEDHYMSVASREQAVSSLERWLRLPHPVIMDVGCSSGYTLKLLRRRMPHAKVLGADYVRRPLDKLSEAFPDLPLFQFNVARCPLESNSVDGVVLLNILEHIEDDARAVQEVYRILRPGGVAVIEVPAGPDLYDIYDQRLMHFRRYGLSDLVRLTRGAGFHVLRSSHLGFFLYPGFWAAKRRNRRLTGAPLEEQQAVIDGSMRLLGHNPVLHSLMTVERTLGRWISYPVGIRCIVVCGK